MSEQPQKSPCNPIFIGVNIMLNIGRYDQGLSGVHFLLQISTFDKREMVDTSDISANGCFTQMADNVTGEDNLGSIPIFSSMLQLVLPYWLQEGDLASMPRDPPPIFFLLVLLFATKL